MHKVPLQREPGWRKGLNNVEVPAPWTEGAVLGLGETYPFPCSRICALRVPRGGTFVCLNFFGQRKISSYVCPRLNQSEEDPVFSQTSCFLHDTQSETFYGCQSVPIQYQLPFMLMDWLPEWLESPSLQSGPENPLGSPPLPFPSSSTFPFVSCMSGLYLCR